MCYHSVIVKVSALYAVTNISELNKFSLILFSFGSIPLTVLIKKDSQASDNNRIDCKILYPITGLKTFNSKLPLAPAKAIVVS